MSTINKVTGKKYRILADAVNKIWEEISFWTSSNDVTFDDGMTAQAKVGSIKGLVTAPQIGNPGYILDSSVAATIPTVLTGTLSAGATTMSFTNSAINSSAKIQIYSSLFGVVPKSAVISGQTLTLTFKAQTTAVTIKVEVSQFGR